MLNALEKESPGVDVQTRSFDIERVRAEFPILNMEVHNHPLVYLDNAASTQKPRVVVDALKQYYYTQNANIHRGVHYLSETATQLYDGTRSFIREFINARSDKEVIFVRGTTEGINLVASSYGRQAIKDGDEILISTIEHHSNIVPWQLLCEATGARLRIIPVDDNGEIILEEYEKLLNSRTRLVAIVHVSNSLGTVNPIKEMTAMAHAHDAVVLVDGAQAVAHQRIDVQDLDCDFYAFSGHKIYGPTGIGVLYGKEQILEEMPPYQGGGDMIESVRFEKTTYAPLPHKFEAGTPNIAGVVGLAQAIQYLLDLGFESIAEHENDIMEHASNALESVSGLRLIGNASNRVGVFSFTIENAHPHDVGTILDRQGIAIRTGNHCTQPAMERFGVPATCRASFAIYNTRDEVTRLIKGIEHVKSIFN